MVITWYGKNCFKIQSGELVLVTDPFEKEKDLTPFRGRADVIIRTVAYLTRSTSSGLTNQKEAADAFEINYAGEYEVKNVSIKGWPTQNLRSVFLAEIDDFKIVLLGHLADESEIKNIQEHLEGADILFIPASGKPFIEVAAAAKLIRQLKPALVIPALFEEFKNLKPFLKELGKNDLEPQEKLTIGKKDLSKEKLTIGCLKI